MDPSDQVHDERRHRGAWYTPPELSVLVARLGLRRWLDEGGSATHVVIVDPACGDGNLLLAARDVLIEAGLTAESAEARLIGLDIDEATVATARSRLPGARIELADGLAWTPDRPVDVVVANPPFLSPLRRRTAHGATTGRRYADGAVMFLERWAGLVAPQGRVAFVMPLSFLSTADASLVRASLAASMTIDDVVAQTTQVFDAAVFTCVVALEQRPPTAVPATTRSTWGHMVAEQFGFPVVGLPPPGPRIGDIAKVRADFRDQYYGLIGAVGDDRDGPPLVTSGLIGHGELHWGSKSVRFAKQRFSAPRVALDALSPELQQWATRRLVPKVLVATQSRRIHAVADPDGALLPGVPVISVMPYDRADVARIAGALRHPMATAWAQCTYVGSALNPRSIKLSARQVSELPLSWE